MDNRLTLLDALKGYAILGVIMVHVLLFSKIPSPLPLFVNHCIACGMYGVQMFFVLSGFTLFMKTGSEVNMDSFRFFFRRIVRIYPLYLFVLAIFILVDFAVLKKNDSVLNLISHLLMLHSLSPTWINAIHPAGWYISVIFLLYLTVMFVGRYIKDLNAAILFFSGALLLSILSRFYMDMNADEIISADFFYMWYPAQLPIFAMGVVCAFLFRGGAVRLKPYGVVCILVTALYIGFGMINLIAIPEYTRLAFLYCGLLLFLLRHTVGWINNRVFAWIGRLSYSVYMSHLLVIYALREFFLRAHLFEASFWHWPVFAGLAIIMSILVAIPLHGFFEIRLPRYVLPIFSREVQK